MLSGMTKPARLGRESFAAHLERVLHRRGLLVVDQGAMRRLDRVDCLLLTADLAVTGRVEPDQVVTAPHADRSEAHRHLRRLFDPATPDTVRRDRGWAVGPLAHLGHERSTDADELAAHVEAERVFGLTFEDTLVAVFDTADEIRAGAHELTDTAHQLGQMVVIAGGDPALGDRLHADLLVDDGKALMDSVRMLQTDGCVVALVSGPGAPALEAADVGIGLSGNGATPWGADIICDDLDHARFLMESADVAHEVSRQASAISLSSASVGSLLALSSPARVAGRRATTAVNTASILSMLNGIRAARSLAGRPPPRSSVRPRWHEMSRSEALTELDTSLEGLSGPAIRERLDPVERPVPLPVAAMRAFASELANPLTPVLAGSALLSATVGSVADAGIVLSVVALNGVISGAQRLASERAVRSLVSASANHAHVRRDGEVQRIPAIGLVHGDIVTLEAGDIVPADCRILQASSLEVDESSLTGESVPVRKSPRAVFGALVAERSCMLYEGTAVVTGSAVAAVVARGDDTEASARIWTNGDDFGSVGGVEARLRDLSTLSLPIAGVSGLVLAVGQLLRGLPIETALGSGISLTVAAVPEGLPMLATAGQLAAARRLSNRGVLVRNPRAIEALGRAEVLCIDKTGTLTRGRVALRLVTDGTVDASVDTLPDHHRHVLAAALRASPGPNSERSLPHFTDRAILEGARKAGVETTLGHDGWEQGEEIAFGPGRPFHAIWAAGPERRSVSIKGSPEYVMPRCRTWRSAAGEQPVDEATKRAVDAHVEGLARQGLRVLAVAEREYDGTEPGPDQPSEDDLTGLTLLGFLALADPVRGTAASAIRGLSEAGVEIVMVTGDHPSTAESIAAELGILNGRAVLNGSDLARMTDAELDRTLPTVSVFARVTPADKVRIVTAYQRSGRPVAMTGDGANDANAIRLADAGIALGEHCAPAARTAADVIILDDRIETIVDTIIEGRALWASIRDALAILLGGNLGEIGFILASGGIIGRPALSTRQILLVNLLTDVAPSLAIAARPPRALGADQLAREGPDRSLGSQLNMAIVQRAVATSAGATAAWGIATLTGRPKHASTVGMVSLVGSQLGQTLTMSRGDPIVMAAAIGSAAVLAAIVQTPGLSQFFGCTPLGPVGWTTAVGSAVAATVAAPLVPSLVERVSGLIEQQRPQELPTLDALVARVTRPLPSGVVAPRHS
jgi:cation-transporting ATPase I